MYAIIRTGGKQYKVQAGDTVRVEKLEKNLGDTFNVVDVLMVGGGADAGQTVVGAPLVANAVVSVTVTRQAKAPKVIVFKKKRRQGYRRMQGHRQLFTELFVNSITTPGGQKFDSEKKAQVVDPAKAQARKDAFAAKQKETKRARSSKVESEEVTAAPAKKVAKKKTAKTGAKKVTKSAAGEGSTAKKKTSKKTSSK